MTGRTAVKLALIAVLVVVLYGGLDAIQIGAIGDPLRRVLICIAGGFFAYMVAEVIVWKPKVKGASEAREREV